MRRYFVHRRKGVSGKRGLLKSSLLNSSIILLLLCAMVLGLVGCQEYNNVNSGFSYVESSSSQAESDSLQPESSSSQPESSSLQLESGSSQPESDSSQPESSNLEYNNKLNYFEALTFHDEAANIHYLLHSPMRKSEEPSPFIIFLHGLGDTVYAESLGTADPLVSTLLELEKNSGEYSTYTLVPKTPGPYDGWWTADQLTAFKRLILNVIETENIDPKRVYISGISMGGFTTCQLVNEMPPNTFAAAVPLSGAYNMTDPSAVKDTAFYIFHAEHDSVVNVDCSRQLYNQLLQSGHPNVTYIEYTSGDHIEPLFWAFADYNTPFFEWLFAQQLP